MTLTTLTFSGHNYKGYASVSEVDTILVADIGRMTTWGSQNEVAKKRAIVNATHRLDLLSWRGKRTDTDRSSQTTEWPRTGLVYEDGTEVADDAIPSRLVRATALLAGTISRVSSNSDARTHSARLRRVKAGSAEVEYLGSTFVSRPIQDETVYQLIRFWLVAGSAAGAFSNAAYGTDGTAFGTPYERAGGFG